MHRKNAQVLYLYHYFRTFSHFTYHICHSFFVLNQETFINPCFNILPIVVFFIMMGITRINLYDSFRDGSLFKTSLMFYIVSITSLFIYLFINNAKLCGNNRDSSKMAVYLKNSWLGRHIGDIICFNSTLAMAFVLLGRVSRGRCDSLTSKFFILMCLRLAGKGGVGG